MAIDERGQGYVSVHDDPVYPATDDPAYLAAVKSAVEESAARCIGAATLCGTVESLAGFRAGTNRVYLA